ncbi:MAG: rRNA maturation RNase YbeY [Rickettsiales bacterium]
MKIKCNFIDQNLVLQKFFFSKNKNIDSKNEFQKYLKEVKKNIEIILQNILEQYQALLYKKIEINLIFASTELIKNLNKDFRNKDSATDVLSFQNYIIDANLLLNDSNYIKKLPSYINLGDIIICLDKLYENIKNDKYNHIKYDISYNNQNSEYNHFENDKHNHTIENIKIKSNLIDMQNSDNNEINFHNHFYYMFVHSFLHLLGFEHEKEDDYIKMELEQTKIMHIINKKIIIHKFQC